MAREPTYTEAADMILRFLDGSGGPWEWDDFTSVRYRDPALESARQRCVEVRSTHPPERPDSYCNDRGVEILRGIASELRKSYPLDDSR